MTKFKLYEDILSRSWNRYFYDVEADTIEEAVEKVRYGEVDCYDSEQIYEVIDELDPVDNNGSPTREIYNDKDELMWHNAELVNRGEIITQGIRSISENLSLIMEGEPESFRGGDIAFSTARRVMEILGRAQLYMTGLLVPVEVLIIKSCGLLIQILKTTNIGIG